METKKEKNQEIKKPKYFSSKDEFVYQMDMSRLRPETINQMNILFNEYGDRYVPGRKK
jgi:hypothetical protein